MTEDGTRCSALEQPLISTADATNTEAEEGPSSQIGSPGDSPKNRDYKTTTATPLSKLCSKCSNIFDHWDRIPYIERNTDFNDGTSSEYSIPRIKSATFSHHHSLLELEGSAKEGCTLCGQFVKDERILEACRERIQELRKRDPHGEFVGQVEVGLFRDQPFVPNCWRLVWNIVPSRVGPDEPKSYASSLSYNSRYSTPTKYLEVCIVSTPGPKTSHGLSSQSGRSVLDLANRWVKECLRSHQCEVGRPDIQRLPTRLVSLVNDYPQLILSTQLSPNARIQYATLSHCWGQSRYSVLERGSIGQFMERIPFTALSKTFLDAMEIARRLEIQYIWIDSLCIIQDDLNDWEKESSLMCSVYGGSTVNIAASGAEDGTIGCLFERDFSRCRIKISGLGKQQFYECFPYDIYGIEMTRMPLMNRGWALQERVLPARTLHFTKTQIYWECRRLSANEIFPYGIPEICRGTSYTRFTKMPVALNMWPWIVETYSRCKLTFNEDKFPAVSGLARELHLQTNDQYLAGLWRRNIESQLCWNTVGLGDRYKNKIAPTWSWASTEAEVRFTMSKPNEHCLARVTKAEIPYSESTLFGKIPNGKGGLHIKCTYLLRTAINSIKRDSTRVFVDICEEGSSIDDSQTVYVRMDSHETTIGGSFYILPLVYDNLTESTRIISGLFLQPTGLKRGEYERVGKFDLYLDSDGMFEILDRIANNPRHRTGPEDYAGSRTDGEGKVNRMITLV